MQSSTKITIFCILAATTFNLLGFTLTSPLNPTIGQHFNLPTGASFGSLTSAYPLGMLIGLFTWPRLSDILGRRLILIISLLGSGIGLSLQSYAVYSGKSLKYFLLSRVFTGMFSGSAPVAKAFLSDIADAREKELRDNDPEFLVEKNIVPEYNLVSKYLGWRDAAATLSYICGPALGGLLYEFIRCIGNSAKTMNAKMTWMNQGRSMTTKAVVGNAFEGRANALSFVIGMSALGSLIASLLIMTFVKDIQKDDMLSSNDDDDEEESSKLEEAAKKDLQMNSCPLGQSLWTGVATVCVISFLYHIADSTFFAFYPALLQSQMGFSAREIGMSFTGFACVSFLFSATSLSSRLIERTGVVNACALGLTAVGTGLLGLSTSASPLVGVGLMKLLTFGAAAMYFAGVPLYGPTIPTMLLLCVPPHQRGSVLGIDGIINTMGRIVSPLLMGEIYRRHGATATFGSASIFVFTSSYIALLRRFFVKRTQRKLAEEGSF
ncbi:hypothetical protein CTEN210_13520 [Chaetoceros tenuissimus]|uniref:Major facilitator superfamily (MFS) profile domain-containing protein n=1 Tax=Chaetoceros tenuissimus TaxID=426638 RepID=A0AAD3D6S9_9STRA|nr:hypothetical protein CTEN210_13520 [Chaetoceros tenuissimus]